MLSLTAGLAVDLGTANTLIYEKGRGVILNEPSVVALETATRRVLAVGREAKSYLGRAPRTIEVIRPLKSGVIYDFAVTKQMIRTFLDLAGVRRRLFKPLIVVGVPSGSTQMEKKAIIEAAEQAGGKSIHLVDEPLAAAVGLGLPITGTRANLVLDVGGGTSEGVLVAQGAVAASESRRMAGDEATEAIARHLRRKHHLAVGENMAEHIKLTLGSAMPLEELPPAENGPARASVYLARGKSTKGGIPTSVEVTDEDIREALEDLNVEFIDMVRRLVEQASPAQKADLERSGLHLTGGGGLLKGLDHRLARELGLDVHVPEDPLVSMVLGLGQILENLDHYRQVFVN